MLVHYYTEVSAPAPAVSDRLVAILTEIESIGSSAYRRGEELYARMGPANAPFAKKVVITVAGPVTNGDSQAFDIAWRAAGASMLFPRMEGELAVAPLGADRCRLTFQGVYEPPLGAMGAVLDRSILGRVADSTVKSWVDGLSAEITSRGSGPPPRGPSLVRPPS